MYIDRFRNRQLSPDGDGTGGKEFVPLDDINAEEELGADGKKLPELDAAAIAAKQKADEDAAAAKKQEDEAAAKVLADEAAAKKAADDAAAAGAGEGGEDEGSFWDDVDKLRGEAIEVDFGDIDPDTPEGALLYEKAVRLDELNKFEQYLETNHPRAYAYLSHVMDGGKEEDFFETAGKPVTLPTEAELENDTKAQEAIVTQNLRAKGNSDKVISTVIKTAIVDDELEEMAKAALKEESDKEANALKAVHDRTEKDTKERQAQIDSMTKFVSELTATGKLDNITIPEKDRVPFAKAINGAIRYENGKFLAVTELTQENILEVFKEKFFGFKKGNLTDLIEQSARAENTKRLKRSIPDGQKKPPLNGQEHKNNFVSLEDMED